MPVCVYVSKVKNRGGGGSVAKLLGGGGGSGGGLHAGCPRAPQTDNIKYIIPSSQSSSPLSHTSCRWGIVMYCKNECV